MGPGAILLRIALSRPGKTVSLYLAHVIPAPILLGRPTDWLAPKVKSVAKGLRLSAEQSFACQNFFLAPDLLALLKFAKLSTGFGMAAFLSPPTTTGAIWNRPFTKGF